MDQLSHMVMDNTLREGAFKAGIATLESLAGGRLLPLKKLNFPKAPVTETEGGHFLQEEVPVEIAAALLRILIRFESQKMGRPNSKTTNKFKESQIRL